MNEPTEINLISTAAQLSPSLINLSEKLKAASQMLLPIFFAVSILVAGSYAILRTQVRSLAGQTASIRSQIANHAEKQALLSLVRDRSKIVGKLISGKVRWDSALTQISGVAPSGTLASIAVDEKRRVVLTMQMNGLDEALTAITAIMKETEEKRMLLPEIVSFQIDENGMSRLVVAYTPVL